MRKYAYLLKYCMPFLKAKKKGKIKLIFVQLNDFYLIIIIIIIIIVFCIFIHFITKKKFKYLIEIRKIKIK